MPKEKFEEQGGIPWGTSDSSGYRPAFPLGNERDARLIDKSSGRPMQEFLSASVEQNDQTSPIGEATAQSAAEGEVNGDQKEEKQ